MSKNTAKTAYIFDTNILIGFGIFTPISFHKNFWDKLESTLKDEKWILLDVVLKEVTYPPDLVEWCKKMNEKGYVTKIDDSHRERAVQINLEYKMIDEVEQKSEADTYIVAFSEAHGNICVCTREGYRDESKPDSLYKIPDVCRKLNIKYKRLPKDFLSAIGI